MNKTVTIHRRRDGRIVVFLPGQVCAGVLDELTLMGAQKEYGEPSTYTMPSRYEERLRALIADSYPKWDFATTVATDLSELRAGRDDFERAVWVWFFGKAKQHDTYGSWSDIPEKVRDHVYACGIATDSELPDLGTVSEFADTPADNDEIPAIIAERWTCNCGKYGDRFDAKRRITLGIQEEINLSATILEVIATADLLTPNPPKA